MSIRTPSFAQQRLWFLDQLLPGRPDYLLPMVLRIRGELDVAALTGALSAIVARHEVLRTRYVLVAGEVMQHIEEPREAAVERVEVGEHELPDLIEREVRRPLDLVTAPPLRLVLARVGARDHVLIAVMHHIGFDGWSWDVFGRELVACYRDGALPPLPMQYTDFADWQRDRLTGPRLYRQLGYWRDRLAGLTALELPTDRPRPDAWDGVGSVVRFDVSADLVATVDRFARANRATRFMVLLSGFHTLLARYTGQADVAIGTPVAGRNRVEMEKLIGQFVNMVVLRADLSGHASFGELVRQVRDDVLGAFTNSEVPFERVVDEVAPDRDLSRNPLFQVSFSVLNAAAAPITLPGLTVEHVPAPLTGTPTDLFLDLIMRPDGTLTGRLQYATALFDESSMQRFADGYQQLLRAVLVEPDAPVLDLAARVEPLPGKERGRLLHRWNDTGRAVPELTVTELFERQALFTPDVLAVRCGSEALSYAELDARTNQLARHLRGLGAGPGTLVGIHLRRGIDLLVAFLAVLKSGAAYVPLDPAYPEQRLRLILADSGARLLITEQPLAGTAVRPVRVDQGAGLPSHPLGRTSRPADLAYLIYTSGSTGTPKGVLVQHRSLTNFLVSMMDRPGLRPGAGLIAQTTVSFDPSALELYLPLLVGAHLVLANDDEARDPHRMVRLIAATRPAAVQATPTYLRMLADAGWSAPAGLSVLSGGEKLPAELAHRLAAAGATVWDLYGPTEATIWATTARLAADGTVRDWAVVANSSVHVLDDRLAPVPVGATGEVCIGGTALAAGYHNRPALTAAAFVPDPHATRPGGRLYRTGDLGRRRPDGAVEILGRLDHQVKIRGHRIEPGEIEAALLGHERISAAVVHPTRTAAGDVMLTAYLVPGPGGLPTVPELRAYLRRTLPEQLLPGAYVPLERLPLTPNGKLDRKALPEPVVCDEPADSPPRTDRERSVASVWREVLGRPRIGVHDNFFEIGGHSLHATKVAVRLRATLGVDVPVRALFDHGTVAELAAALPGYPAVAELPAILPRRGVPVNHAAVNQGGIHA